MARQLRRVDGASERRVPSGRAETGFKRSSWYEPRNKVSEATEEGLQAADRQFSGV